MKNRKSFEILDLTYRTKLGIKIPLGKKAKIKVWGINAEI